MGRCSVDTYETIFITPPALPEEEEQEAVDALAKVVTDGGGVYVVNERLGRRRLAYPIQRFDDGMYVRFLYDSGVEVPRELMRRARLSDRVLRSLTVRLEPDWAVGAKRQVVLDAERRELEAAEAAAREAAGIVEGASADALPPTALRGASDDEPADRDEVDAADGRRGRSVRP